MASSLPEPYPRAYLYRRIVLAKTYVDAHYAEDLNVGAIADEAYFSKYHFIRLFRMAYGKTPYQYLQSVRVERARQLLKEGEMSVTAVCYAVGFRSPGSFSALFKKQTGESPAAYRSKHRGRWYAVQQRPLAFIPGCFARAHGVAPESQF
jgi:AraC-like DNA-binding protein